MTDRAACRNCRHFWASLHGQGECRRFPPEAAFEPTGRVSRITPVVGAYYWCGEFSAGTAPSRAATTPEEIEAVSRQFDEMMGEPARD